jgi:hypothetical protein
MMWFWVVAGVAAVLVGIPIAVLLAIVFGIGDRHRHERRWWPR